MTESPVSTGAPTATSVSAASQMRGSGGYVPGRRVLQYPPARRHEPRLGRLPEHRDGLLDSDRDLERVREVAVVAHTRDLREPGEPTVCGRAAERDEAPALERCERGPDSGGQRRRRPLNVDPLHCEDRRLARDHVCARGEGDQPEADGKRPAARKPPCMPCLPGRTPRQRDRARARRRPRSSSPGHGADFALADALPTRGARPRAEARARRRARPRARARHRTRGAHAASPRP